MREKRETAQIAERERASERAQKAEIMQKERMKKCTTRGARENGCERQTGDNMCDRAQKKERVQQRRKNKNERA